MHNFARTAELSTKVARGYFLCSSSTDILGALHCEFYFLSA